MPPVGDDVDLGRWAAYAVGHHPYALLAWHMDCWTAFQDAFTIIDRGHRHGAPPELGGLDEALDVLSAKGLVDAVAFNRIRGQREAFVAISKEIKELTDGDRLVSEVVDIDSPLEPSYGTMLCMIEACDGLITGPDNLLTWLHLGAAVGEYPLIVTRGITSKWQSLGDCFDDLRDLIQKLAQPGEFEFLPEIDHHLAKLDPAAEPPPGDSYTPPFGSQLQAVADLDGVIRHALRSQAPPEVWFDLDSTRLILFGVPFSVDRHLEGDGDHSPRRRLSLPEAAILWVLAEKAGEVVHRKTIRAEGKIAPAHDRQQEVICRMRGRLRDAVYPYFAARGWELSYEAQMCFIVSVPGGGKSGPYKLAMDKCRVRLPQNRPDWMKARAD